MAAEAQSVAAAQSDSPPRRRSESLPPSFRHCHVDPAELAALVRLD
jgi:hypothetical protein